MLYTPRFTFPFSVFIKPTFNAPLPRNQVTLFNLYSDVCQKIWQFKFASWRWRRSAPKYVGVLFKQCNSVCEKWCNERLFNEHRYLLHVSASCAIIKELDVITNRSIKRILHTLTNQLYIYKYKNGQELIKIYLSISFRNKFNQPFN